MAPFLKGPKPFAVVLLTFNDLPIFPAAREQLETFTSAGGKGGLWDFWRDVSYANINLAESEVFGWFKMKYSYAHDSSDPLHDGTTRARQAWIQEARRLCEESKIDLSRFYGVIAVVNANVDDSSNGTTDTAIAISQFYGQGDWRHCNKCDELVFSGNNTAGPCPAGGQHDPTNSTNYRLSINNDLFIGQSGWKWCNKCQALCFAEMGPHPCAGGGDHDHTGSGSYRVGTSDLAYPGQDQWKSCTKCQCLSFSADGSPGSCAAGGAHDYTSSFNYKLAGTNDSFNDTFSGHETGHCFGLSHSFSANPDTEYGDPFDIMSAMRVASFQNKDFPGSEAGPGLNSPTLLKLGWLNADRVLTHRTSSNVPITINLAPLNRPENDGHMMINLLGRNHVYTIEYRQPNGWDAGIGGDIVLIHELRSCYTYGQRNWRWCKKCQGLALSEAVCAAGSLHNYAGSMNYKVVRDNAALVPGGQSEWKFCQKCSLLSYSGNPIGAGPCPAGGVHDQSRSGDYTLPINNASQIGQRGWKWCTKCQGLSYGLNASPGTCVAGGYHEHSGSGDYQLAGDNPAALGDSQFRWCNKCQGLAGDGFSHCATDGLAHDLSESADYGLSIDDANYPGQDGWMFCWKCNGLNFANAGPRPCAAGGSHENAGGMIRLQRTADGLQGQSQWKSCNKCQLLSFTGLGISVKCPAGGDHDHTGSWDYTLPNFNDDRTYLIGQGLFQGQNFIDGTRNVQVHVDRIDSVAGLATVTVRGLGIM